MCKTCERGSGNGARHAATVSAAVLTCGSGGDSDRGNGAKHAQAETAEVRPVIPTTLGFPKMRFITVPPTPAS